MRTSEFAHKWANNTERHGRLGNVSCRYGEYYSYNAVIGKYIGKDKTGRDIFWVTNRSYSRTTADHVGDLLQAIWGLIIRSYEEPMKSSHDYNIKWLLQDLNDITKKYNNARTKKDYYYLEIEDAKANILNYIKYFKVRKTKLSSEVKKKYNIFFEKDAMEKNPSKRFKRIEDKKEREKERKRLEAIKREQEKERKWRESHSEEVQKIVDKCERWLRGEEVDYPSSGIATPLAYRGVKLRIKGNRIETSRGAIVGRRDAMKMYRAFKKGEDVTNKTVGGYTIREIKDDSVQIGCHLIKIKEIDRLIGIKEE